MSVHAVDVTLPLRVSVSARPDYPFVSTLKLSLGDAPECNVRITPLSSERYVKSCNNSLVVSTSKSFDAQFHCKLTSFGLIVASSIVDYAELTSVHFLSSESGSKMPSEKVSQNTYRPTLLLWTLPRGSIMFQNVNRKSHGIGCFLSPVYPSLNLLIHLYHHRTSIPTRSLGDITLLRQRTKELVNPNPRTPSSAGMTISSLADTLQSHRSSTGTAFVQGNRKAAFDPTGRKDFHSLIKPTTELSKRGMDRFIEKLQKTEQSEVDSQDGLASLFTRSLATLSPLFVAVAGKHSLLSSSFLVSLLKV